MSVEGMEISPDVSTPSTSQGGRTQSSGSRVFNFDVVSSSFSGSGLKKVRMAKTLKDQTMWLEAALRGVVDSVIKKSGLVQPTDPAALVKWRNDLNSEAYDEFIRQGNESYVGMTIMQLQLMLQEYVSKPKLVEEVNIADVLTGNLQGEVDNFLHFRPFIPFTALMMACKDVTKENAPFVTRRFKAWGDMCQNELGYTLPEYPLAGLNDLIDSIRKHILPRLDIQQVRLNVATSAGKKTGDAIYILALSQGRLLLEGQGMRMRNILYEIAKYPTNLWYLKALDDERERYVESYERVRTKLGPLFSIMATIYPGEYLSIQTTSYPKLLSAAIAYDQWSIKKNTKTASEKLKSLEYLVQSTPPDNRIYMQSMDLLDARGSAVTTPTAIIEIQKEGWYSETEAEKSLRSQRRIQEFKQMANEEM